MRDSYEYECALSGLSAPGGPHFPNDGLDDLPPGWTEVRLSRRVYNPKWVLIQRVKEAMVAGHLLQVPEEMRKGQRVAVQLQVDAQFFNLEDATPAYLTEVETVYLAPPELSDEVRTAYNEARELLGLEPASTNTDGEEEQEGEEEAASASEKKLGKKE